MSKHRNPRPKVPKRPTPDNPDSSVLVERLYGDLVELEGLAVTADECVTALPVFPTGRYRRTLMSGVNSVGVGAFADASGLEERESHGVESRWFLLDQRVLSHDLAVNFLAGDRTGRRSLL